VSGVVGIGVAARQAEAALTDQGGEIVGNLPGLAPLGDAGRQPGAELQGVVDRFEENDGAAGALLGVSKVTTRGFWNSVGNSAVCTACSATRVPPL
jgi:hypothetical protein